MDYAISVIVPIYNAERWLRRCVTSILKQPFSHIELLLVNDGSNDQSGAICEEFAAKDDRVKVIHQANAGASNAKNSGIDAATGKYISFIDADDEIAETFFVKLHAAAEEHACGVVISGFQTTPALRHVAPQFKLHSLMSGKDLVLSSAAVHSNNDLCFCWRNLFNRKLLKSSGIRFHEELVIGEDTIFNLEAFLHAERVYAIPDPLYLYNTNNPDSIMSTPYHPKLESSLILQYQWRKGLSAKFGLLSHPHYRQDMADYHIKSVYGMIMKCLKNSPVATHRSDFDQIIHYEMFTDSTKEIGYRYKCSTLKEYLHYFALKFKLSSLLFSREFRSDKTASPSF